MDMGLNLVTAKAHYLSSYKIISIVIGFDEVFLYKRSSLLYAACKPIYNIERDINIGTIKSQAVDRYTIQIWTFLPKGHNT